MSILQTSDFLTGEYKISKDCFQDMQPYFDKYEKEALCDLLGAELYDLFIADLTAVTPQIPQTQRFTDIFEEFKVDEGNWVIKSEGMIEMLKQFVYYRFMSDIINSKNSSGVSRIQTSTSERLAYNGYNLVQAYNEGVENYRAIQWFILDERTTYLEENTQRRSYNSGI